MFTEFIDINKKIIVLVYNFFEKKKKKRKKTEMIYTSVIVTLNMYLPPLIMNPIFIKYCGRIDSL